MILHAFQMFWKNNFYFHTGMNIIQTHETTDAQFTHQLLNYIFYVIDVGSTFLIFAEHAFACFIGITDACGHGFHDGRYLFHIFHQLTIGRFHFFHGRINCLDVFTQKRRILCNFIYIFTGLGYFFQSGLNKF